MLTICIIEGHNSKHLEKCKESISKNTSSIYRLEVFKEKDTRELTLNTILSALPDKDLIIAADDIVFTRDWDKALNDQWNDNRIIGFSMLYPETNIIQNRGYRLISIDDNVSSDALDNRLKKDDVVNFDYRNCQTITGCFQAIPSKVIKEIPEFPLEGRNRLGELLYHSIAIRKGFEVGVLGHYLEHHAISTKNNPNHDLASESYLKEKSIWQDAVIQFNLNDFVEERISREIDQNIIDWLKEPCVIYGAGTITEFIGSKLGLESHIICSGLKEEEGLMICNQKIRFKRNVNWSNFKRVLIAVNGREKIISEDILQLAPHIKICAVNTNKSKSLSRYELVNINEL